MKLNWKPSETFPSEIKTTAPEAVIAALKEAGLSFPCTLGDDDLPILRAMAAVAADPAPYKTLVHLITMHDTIDLFTEE